MSENIHFDEWKQIPISGHYAAFKIMYVLIV